MLGRGQPVGQGEVGVYVDRDPSRLQLADELAGRLGAGSLGVELREAGPGRTSVLVYVETRDEAERVAADFRAVGRSSVVLARDALAGKDPGAMPLTSPRSYRVIVNLEAARRSGFEVPLALLAAADEFAGVAGGR